MNGYIFTIIAISVISGIISSMLSANKNSLKRYINFISGLICSIALLTPIVTIAGNIGAFSDSIESIIDSLNTNEGISSTNEIIIETGKEQIEQGIKKAIISKFGFSEEDIAVKVIVNDENIEAVILEKTEIILRNKASWTDEQQIKTYVESLVGCRVDIKKY